MSVGIAQHCKQSLALGAVRNGIQRRSAANQVPAGLNDIAVPGVYHGPPAQFVAASRRRCNVIASARRRGGFMLADSDIAYRCKNHEAPFRMRAAQPVPRATPLNFVPPQPMM